VHDVVGEQVVVDVDAGSHWGLRWSHIGGRATRV
jgi:hypothetical protein